VGDKSEDVVIINLFSANATKHKRLRFSTEAQPLSILAGRFFNRSLSNCLTLGFDARGRQK
jgi:hypothetical protein